MLWTIPKFCLSISAKSWFILLLPLFLPLGSEIYTRILTLKGRSVAWYYCQESLLFLTSWTYLSKSFKSSSNLTLILKTLTIWWSSTHWCNILTMVVLSTLKLGRKWPYFWNESGPQIKTMQFNLNMICISSTNCQNTSKSIFSADSCSATS